MDHTFHSSISLCCYYSLLFIVSTKFFVSWSFFLARSHSCFVSLSLSNYFLRHFSQTVTHNHHIRLFSILIILFSTNHHNKRIFQIYIICTKKITSSDEHYLHIFVTNNIIFCSIVNVYLNNSTYYYFCRLLSNISTFSVCV